MADLTFRAESARVITPNDFPPARAGRIAAGLLNRHSAHEIAEAVEILVDVLDLMGGDPDDEPGGDDEPVEANGDTRDAAWIEWQTKHGNYRRRGGPEMLAGHEDDEEDDPPEDDNDDAEHDGREAEEGL